MINLIAAISPSIYTNSMKTYSYRYLQHVHFVIIESYIFSIVKSQDIIVTKIYVNTVERVEIVLELMVYQ